MLDTLNQHNWAPLRKQWGPFIYGGPQIFGNWTKEKLLRDDEAAFFDPRAYNATQALAKARTSKLFVLWIWRCIFIVATSSSAINLGGGKQTGFFEREE